MEKLNYCSPIIILRRVLLSSLVCSRKNITLSYKIIGEATSEPPMPPIFIIHGFLGNKKQWEGIGKTILSITKRTVVAVDLRNHGDSPHVKSHKYTHQAKDVIYLLEKLGARQASLIGHSLGGRTAMCVALMAPLKVAGLLVVDISPVSTAPQHREILPKILNAMKEINFDKTTKVSVFKKDVRSLLKELVIDEYMMQAILGNIIRKPDGNVGWSCNVDVLLKHVEHLLSFPEELKSKTYDGPTLFIGGQLSAFIPADDLTHIRQIFPRAVIIYIPKTRHRVHEDDPKTFLELTISFLNTHVYNNATAII